MNSNAARRFFRFTTAFLALGTGLYFTADAREGVWLPPLVKEREADMKAMGLQIPVERLYGEDGKGLNNAVVLFGKGCTAEVISSQGLLLTNHHCGYGTVQGLSSRERDYFAHGFWAADMSQEIPCPGLTVTFYRKMEHVTEHILGGLPDTLSPARREEVIASRIATLERSLRRDGTIEVAVKPYYYGNQYWALYTETFRDVRLVAFPPNGIGSFGGDTDNWMWPRHNGDFSLFRVYAGKDNRPADYDPSNKPYQAKEYFTINTGGYKEGDFAMVYGFPGMTQEYITASQLEQVYGIIDPVRIEARTMKLDVWNYRMERSRDVFIKYTSKRAVVANGWKKWQGELRGLRLNDVPAKKRAYEREFQEWASKPSSPRAATTVLGHIEAAANAVDSVLKAEEYIKEAVLGIELIQQGALLNDLLRRYREGKAASGADKDAQRLASAWEQFFKNYDMETDRELFEALMSLFFEKAPSWVPGQYRQLYREHGSSFYKWAQGVYARSLVASEARMKEHLEKGQPADSTVILNDPAWQLYQAIQQLRAERIIGPLSSYYNRIAELNRLYMHYRMEKDQGKDYYPDANLTLRLSYGKVKGIDPDGPAEYTWQTNFDQVIAKDQPGSHEFALPQGLKDLYARKDYGRWAVKGTVPVNFVTDCHTSGGNSGSPVLNARGELIGLNFDRIWEGTMSDLYFDPNLCRNISVDIRYVLFLIEKYGNAGWLLKEMNIVKK
jgi:hypothetical protein